MTSTLRISPASLDWALLHLESEGDTDIFPIPFEIAALRYVWNRPCAFLQKKSFRDWLSSIDPTEWPMGPQRRALTPKHRFGYRVATQPDPLDTLLWTALTYEIGPQLEALRLPTADKRAFAYRFAPSAAGGLFDASSHYGTFRKHCTEFIEANDDFGDSSWVAVADIADFYPRIYLHPMENALRQSGAPGDHIIAITRMAKAWNHNVSYGLPVGPSASRLLAEVTIDSVDRALLSEGYTFCRFVDDYRVFCDSERSAHVALAYLAQVLFDHHDLTLQQGKTAVLPADTFKIRFGKDEEATERAELANTFAEILERSGISDPYSAFTYEDLDDEAKKAVDALNLVGVLTETLNAREPDLALVRFVIGRLRQLQDDSAADLLLDQLNKLFPIFQHVAEYLAAIQPKLRDPKSLGDRLLQLVTKDESLVGHLGYHRQWILSLFARGTTLNHADRFAGLATRFAGDEFAFREIVLARGKTRDHAWFKTRKRDVEGMPPWVKRAFLVGARCLPGDESEHWYRSLAPRLTALEHAVVEWAKVHGP